MQGLEAGLHFLRRLRQLRHPVRDRRLLSGMCRTEGIPQEDKGREAPKRKQILAGSYPALCG
jgi:hypothetical protein